MTRILKPSDLFFATDAEKFLNQPGMVTMYTVIAEMRLAAANEAIREDSELDPETPDENQAYRVSMMRVAEAASDLLVTFNNMQLVSLNKFYFDPHGARKNGIFDIAKDGLIAYEPSRLPPMATTDSVIHLISPECDPKYGHNIAAHLKLEALTHEHLLEKAAAIERAVNGIADPFEKLRWQTQMEPFHKQVIQLTAKSSTWQAHIEAKSGRNTGWDLNPN